MFRRDACRELMTFDIDSSGILGVRAKDTASGRAQAIRMKGSPRRSGDCKKRWIEEAERYADSDGMRRAAADRPKADADERMLASFDDEFPDDLSQRIDTALRETEGCSS